MPNEIENKKQDETAKAERPEDKLRFAASKLTNIYISDLSKTNEMVGVDTSPESRRCAMNLILALCSEHGMADVQNLPREQLLAMIQFVMINGLDVNAGQVFVDKRKDSEGKLVSVKATPQGSAWEIMVRRWGADVKALHQARVIHEGDIFELPQYEGLKVTPLIHKPTFKGLDGKAIGIYYIVEKKDGSLDYLVTTREGVAKNLMAQILNAALKDRNINRDDLMQKMDGKSLDELLTDPYLRQFISPAYRSPSSREQMIITKMKANALRHYTRDLGDKSNMDTATKKAIDEGADDDMINKNVVGVTDGEEAEKPAKALPKIQDFEVDDIPQEPTAKPAEIVAEPAPIAEVVKPEEPKEKSAEPAYSEPETKKAEPEHRQVSIFDVEDL